MTVDLARIVFYTLSLRFLLWVDSLLNSSLGIVKPASGGVFPCGHASPSSPVSSYHSVPSLLFIPILR